MVTPEMIPMSALDGVQLWFEKYNLQRHANTCRNVKYRVQKMELLYIPGKGASRFDILNKPANSPKTRPPADRLGSPGLLQ